LLQFTDFPNSSFYPLRLQPWSLILRVDSQDEWFYIRHRTFQYFGQSSPGIPDFSSELPYRLTNLQVYHQPPCGLICSELTFICEESFLDWSIMMFIPSTRKTCFDLRFKFCEWLVIRLWIASCTCPHKELQIRLARSESPIARN
jgi:hypothetical protein